MAGNVALLKHASNVPMPLAIESLVLVRFPARTFRPAARINQVETILGDERMRSHRHCSETAGRAIGAQAAGSSKSPSSSSRAATRSSSCHLPTRSRDRNCGRRACVNSGQSCIAAKRFIVADEIYDAFESRFVAGMEQCVSRPHERRHQIAPSRRFAVSAAEAQIKAATHVGHASLRRRNRCSRRQLLRTHLLAGVPRSSPVYREELFAPSQCSPRPGHQRGHRDRNDTPSALPPRPGHVPVEQQRLSRAAMRRIFLNRWCQRSTSPLRGIKRSGYGANSQPRYA